MTLYGMEQGKHVACEVPVAYTLEDCWKLIETVERTQKHCIMQENCRYNNEEELAWWGHEWLKPEKYNEYREKHNHPLWDKLKTQISVNSVGHGGMDFVMIYRLIRCLNQGLPLDINVYDSVLWSAITPLSELSVAQNSSSIKVPDFTGGTWKNNNKSEMLRDI